MEFTNGFELGTNWIILDELSFIFWDQLLNSNPFPGLATHRVLENNIMSRLVEGVNPLQTISPELGGVIWNITPAMRLLVLPSIIEILLALELAI